VWDELASRIRFEGGQMTFWRLEQELEAFLGSLPPGT